jgi:hypothetical protein
VTDKNFRNLSLSPSPLEPKPSFIEIPRSIFISTMSKKKLPLVAILLLSLTEFAVCTTRQRIAFVDLEARDEDEQRELEMGVEAGGSIPSHKKVEATNGNHQGPLGGYPEALPEAASALKVMQKMKAWSPPIAAEVQSTTERKMAKEPKLLKKPKVTESTTKSVKSESKKEGKRTKTEKGKRSKKSSKGTGSPVSTSVPTSSDLVPSIPAPQTAPTNPATPTGSTPLPTTRAPKTKGKGSKKSSKGTDSPTSVPTSSTPVPTVLPTVLPSYSPIVYCANECCSDDECPQSSVCVGRNCVQDGILRVTLTWYGIGKTLATLSQQYLE